MAIHESKPMASDLFIYIFLLTTIHSWRRFIFTTSICLSTYLKVIKVHATGRPSGHDNNLFDVKGLSLWFDYAFRMCLVFASKVSLACEVEVDKSFSVLYKST